jgi:hypothetical protein
MNEQDWLARVAYHAYCDACNYKTINGESTKLWDDLDSTEKQRWVQVSQSTIEGYKRECNRKQACLNLRA